MLRQSDLDPALRRCRQQLLDLVLRAMGIVLSHAIAPDLMAVVLMPFVALMPVAGPIHAWREVANAQATAATTPTCKAMTIQNTMRNGSFCVL
jgi:hypothetical protein